MLSVTSPPHVRRRPGWRRLWVLALGGFLAATCLAWLPPSPRQVRDAAFAQAVRRGDAHLAAVRAAYVPGDWHSVYRLAVVLCMAREFRTLRLTDGDRSQAMP